jgi:DNA-binding MarR family transcriptional regulator
MEEKLKLAEIGIGKIFEELHYRGDLKFRFVALWGRSVTQKKDYGTGESISMLDAHILKQICERPGISSSELVHDWGRTRGAICQIVTRLEDAGYLQRQPLENNAKTIALLPTEKGRELTEYHKRYDVLQTSKLINELLEHCTMEEINGYFKVLEYQIKCYESNNSSGAKDREEGSVCSSESR